MSEQNPYEQLGLTEDASFDDIQAARNRLGAEFANDQKQLEKIEAAYDAVLMERLKLRQEGKIKVPDRIRFAERMVESPPSNAPQPQNQTLQWFSRFMDQPSRSDILLPAGGMSALILLVVFAPPSSVLSIVQMSLLVGLGATFYFLFRKERKLGRTVALGFGALFLGLPLGLGIFNLLQIANLALPISPQAFASAIAFVVFWLVSSFLK
jgi:Protein CHAPERONE-LIKE PROTEIN OF POR1-like